MITIDPFKDKVLHQMGIGTRHHTNDIHQAYLEYVNLSKLAHTFQDDDREHYEIRGMILALDLDNRPIPTLHERRN